jgi:hypothetical protein
VESDSLLFDLGMAENKSSPLFEAVVLCSGSSLELLLSSVMFTDLLGSDVLGTEGLLVPVPKAGSDVLGTEGLLVPVPKDCLKFVILPMMVFGGVTDSADSDVTESSSKVPSGSRFCKLSGGSVIWTVNAVK